MPIGRPEPSAYRSPTSTVVRHSTTPPYERPVILTHERGLLEEENKVFAIRTEFAEVVRGVGTSIDGGDGEAPQAW